MVDRMLNQIVDATFGTGVSPSGVPELVAAYQVDQEHKGRPLTGDQAASEIRAYEILCFGLEGNRDLRSTTLFGGLPEEENHG